MLSYFKILSVLILALVCESAIAVIQSEVCSTVRLDGIGGPYHDIPLYNQRRFADHDSEICYAVSAAQLIDGARRRANPGASLTSPISPALAYKSRTESISPTFPSNPNPTNIVLGGGQIYEAISWIRGKQVCDAKFLEKYARLTGASHSNGIASQDDKSTDEFFKLLLASVTDWKNARTQLSSRQAMISFIACNQNLSSLSALLGVQNNNALSNLASALDAAAAKHFSASETISFLSKICKGHSHVVATPKPEILGHDRIKEQFGMQSPRATSAELERKANELMDSHIPKAFAISYKPEILSGRTSASPDSYGHASIVIGRRRNPGTKNCEFLIRNSYGTDCTDPFSHRPYTSECEGGQIWVTSTLLFPNSEHIVWIPDK